MKVVILAGGFGTRLSEETSRIPKPMVEIGGRPILWHIMQTYSAHGFNEFVIALGYKAEVVKEYFLNYHALRSNLSVNLASGEIQSGGALTPPWKVDLIDTGLHTQTGGRLKRLRPWLGDETFMMTYGDGVSDVPISSLVEFHRSHGKAATVTAVRPPSRFGALRIEDNQVLGFKEKPNTGEGWINGGYFVLEPSVLDTIQGDEMPFEEAPLEALAGQNQLMAFEHEGFWQPMDTLRDRMLLEQLWNSGNAPWKQEERCQILGVAA